jgi:hypothetical protein
VRYMCARVAFCDVSCARADSRLCASPSRCRSPRCWRCSPTNKAYALRVCACARSHFVGVVQIATRRLVDYGLWVDADDDEAATSERASSRASSSGFWLDAAHGGVA